MPKSSLKRQEFGAKKPYLVATVFCLILILYAYGWFYQKNAAERGQQLEKLKNQLAPLQKMKDPLERAMKDMRDARKEADQFAEWVEERPYWANVLVDLRRVMMDTEVKGKEKFNTATGVWIEKMSFGTLASASSTTPTTSPPTGGGGNPFPTTPGGAGGRRPRLGGGTPPGGPASTTTHAPAATGVATTITLVCRAVDLTNVKAGANNDFAFMVDAGLKACPQFDPANTGLVGAMSKPADFTFTFEVAVTLKRPNKP